MLTNPYESPSAVTTLPRQVAVWKIAVSLLPAAYPLLLSGAFYGTWLIGWFSLGHAPRPYLDDPCEIGYATFVAYIAAGCVLLIMPVGVFGSGVIYVWQVIQWNWSQRLRYTFIIGIVWVTVFTLLRSDPWRVQDWFFD